MGLSMSSKSVLSSCAVLVLSAVLSTGWASSTQNNSYTVNVNDSNTVMKANEQDLKNSQGTAATTQTDTEALKSGIESGAIQDAPSAAYAAEVAAKKEADQKAFCQRYPATYVALAASTLSATEKAKVCTSYTPDGAVVAAMIGGVSAYCYAYVNSTKVLNNIISINCKNKY